MAKEPDQTRWRGIRPTDPSEDIPVTLGAEVVHVIVDAGGGGGLTPGQPKLSTDERTMIADTFVTLVNYVGAGAFTSFWVSMQAGGVAGTTLKITIDGGAPLEVYLNDDQLDETLNIDFIGNHNRNCHFDWGLIGFATSLKVEFKHANAIDLTTACFWQTH